MPNRIIRDGILTSERVNRLTPHAEIFYRRLMSVVDDYGRYHANPTLLRSACYPLQIDKVKDKDISAWLEECKKAVLVLVYTASGKDCLELLDFRQQVRARDSKYPSLDAQTRSKCIADAKQLIANAHLDVGEGVVVGEDGGEDGGGGRSGRGALGTFGEFGKVRLSDEEYLKLIEKHGKDRADAAIEILDGYIASKNKRYANHYAVLKEGSWVWERLDKRSDQRDANGFTQAEYFAAARENDRQTAEWVSRQAKLDTERKKGGAA